MDDVIQWAVGLSLPSMVTLFGGWLVWQSRKNDTKNTREGRIEARMDLLEKKLDRVQAYLRAEQRFSHRLVLAVQTVIAYIARAAAYRAAHDLPGDPPPLPDIDELQELIKLRPTYGPDDDLAT